MKHLLHLSAVAGLSFVCAAVIVSRHTAARHAGELAAQRAAWEQEKAALAAALQQAQARPQRTVARPAPVPVVPTPGWTAPEPEELLARLVSLPISSHSGQGRALRPVLVLMEQLAQAGPAALPSIRQFLDTGRDVAYDASSGKGTRDVKLLTEALVPPSLRFALFDVVRQIGGMEAEAVLVAVLGQTGRGIEVAGLTQLLENLAPGQYKTAALAAARHLLAAAPGTDRADRDYLYGVLRRFNDATFVRDAQAQLVQADGQVDRSALRYLHQTLGEQTLPLLAQTYRDNRLAAPGTKEPLARVALAYVGGNPQAVELWHTAILDPSLSSDQKRNLIEDLNEDGLVNKRDPASADLPLIANRYALTQAYLQEEYVRNDKLLDAAFREADKDLRNLLEKAAVQGASPPTAPVK